jgi:pimeloyl-ACP methyl ester carboxylesterase
VKRHIAGVLVALTATALGAPSATAQAGGPELSPYKFVQLPGMRAGYREAGSGRPLVLIAGYSLTAAEWDPDLVSRLAAHRRVVVFDNRGVAISTGSVRRLSIAQMAGDTANLIRALQLRRPDVLGWSMGGYIAQELALRYPRSLRRLLDWLAAPVRVRGPLLARRVDFRSRVRGRRGPQADQRSTRRSPGTRPGPDRAHTRLETR